MGTAGVNESDAARAKDESSPCWSHAALHSSSAFSTSSDLLKLAAGLLILAGDEQGDHAWYLFQATGDILIHTAPYQIVDGKKIYQDIDALGVRPSSRGCIRIHPDDAEWLVKWNPQGAWIVITSWEGAILR